MTDAWRRPSVRHTGDTPWNAALMTRREVVFRVDPRFGLSRLPPAPRMHERRKSGWSAGAMRACWGRWFPSEGLLRFLGRESGAGKITERESAPG
jgi:hypothetical protein